MVKHKYHKKKKKEKTFEEAFPEFEEERKSEKRKSHIARDKKSDKDLEMALFYGKVKEKELARRAEARENEHNRKILSKKRANISGGVKSYYRTDSPPKREDYHNDLLYEEAMKKYQDTRGNKKVAIAGEALSIAHPVAGKAVSLANEKNMASKRRTVAGMRANKAYTESFERKHGKTAYQQMFGDD